jgi:hypothetical protein
MKSILLILLFNTYLLANNSTSEPKKTNDEYLQILTSIGLNNLDETGRALISSSGSLELNWYKDTWCTGIEFSNDVESFMYSSNSEKPTQPEVFSLILNFGRGYVHDYFYVNAFGGFGWQRYTDPNNNISSGIVGQAGVQGGLRYKYIGLGAELSGTKGSQISVNRVDYTLSIHLPIKIDFGSN